MNSKKSKTSDPHRLLLNLTDKINLKSSDEYVALSNLSIYYTSKNVKRHITTIHLKYQLQHEMKNLNYLMDHTLYQILKIISNIYLRTCRKDCIPFNKNMHKQNRK